MTYYECICGSRSHGIELPTSDYDVVICSSGSDFVDLSELKHHNITIRPENMVFKLMFKWKVAHDVQIYFPSKIIQQTELIDYIIDNRESIIRANSAAVYESYMRFCDRFNDRIDDKNYFRWIKDSVYACMYCNILHTYATQDVAFEDVFVPKADFKEWIVLARSGEISRNEILTLYSELYDKATKVHSCYEGPLDKAFLTDTLSNINDLLDTNIDIRFR